MTRTEAKKLKVGDRLTYMNDPLDCGTVVSINPGACINVHWDNGEKSATHPDDMGRMSKREVSNA